MKYIVNLNNKVYEVEVEKGEAQIIDEYDACTVKPVAEPKINNDNTKHATENIDGNVVKAPIPGNILSVKVSEGQPVKAGDVLILIEAMKMENEVCAPQNGTVKKILVSNGQTVATGDDLVII